MEAEEQFVNIAGLICEPARAKMLWNLLDGRAYTATELSAAADISTTAASNHLAKLLAADIVKFEMQGRHRYYSFSKPEIAYAVEALANLANEGNSQSASKGEIEVAGLKYCRTCYDHLAGFVAVRMAEALEKKGCLIKTDKAYTVTNKGWKWFAGVGVFKADFSSSRRPLTRQCLDWSERRPHLAGQLGAVFLQKMLARKWFKRVQFSRELQVTSKGRQEIADLLLISL